ncbi:MAG: XRE family transcriptional regulator [Acholeplasmatales bacterium]|nr:MAG: XRE family transcriptional regulator [Acholeplasmatales bacterium]
MLRQERWIVPIGKYNLDALGENIRSLRETHGYSRERFSELTNVSARMVYNWENGTSTPNYTRLIQIAQLFGVLIDDLLSNK